MSGMSEVVGRSGVHGESEKAMTTEDLTIGSYWFPSANYHTRPGEVQAVRVVNREGVHSWAVRCGGSCMSRSGTWTIEPIPSSRTDAWIRSHRFESAQQALDAYMHRGRKNLEKQ